MSQAHYLTLVGIKMEKPSIGPLSQNINIHLKIRAVRVRFNDLCIATTISVLIFIVLTYTLLKMFTTYAGEIFLCLSDDDLNYSVFHFQKQRSTPYLNPPVNKYLTYEI